MSTQLVRPARILLATSRRDLAEPFGSALRHCGYQVSENSDEEYLKNLLTHDSFNLIVLDDSSCGGGDSCLLSYIKQRYPATLVIIVSENSSIHRAIECIRMGAYDYLVGPFDEENFLGVVRNSLDRQRVGLRHKEMTRSLEEKVIHLQQLNQRMAALYKIIRDTRGLATLEDSLLKVLDYLGEAIDLEYSFCLLLDDKCEDQVVFLTQGRENELGLNLLQALRVPGEKVRQAFRDGKHINEVSLEVERDLLDRGIHPESFRNIMVCPLNILKSLYGYLCLVNDPERQAYTFADRQMLSIIASQSVAIAEENHNLMQSSQLITMGNLTAELAHDLKTPLCNVKGILQTLDGKWEDESVRSEALKMVQEELARADNMTLELLAFAKTQELEIGYWNIHDLLRKSLLITKNTLAKARVELQTKFQDEPLMAWVNDNEIADAFVNIIVNASQAMPDGGALTISTRHTLHQGMTSRNRPSRGRYMQIEFTDTGIGMTRWELDRIFERFYTTKTSGTGLGLSIVDRVVKKYQGFIDVKSVKNEGTSFFINLPLR